MPPGETMRVEQGGSREPGAGSRTDAGADGSRLPAPDPLGPLREADSGRLATDRLTALFHRVAAVKEVSLAFAPRTVMKGT